MPFTRKNIRLAPSNYLGHGIYFVTICSYNRKSCFADTSLGHVVLGHLMSLSARHSFLPTPSALCPIIFTSWPRAPLPNAIFFRSSRPSNNSHLSHTKIALKVRSGKQNSTTTFCVNHVNWNRLLVTSGRTRSVKVSVRMQRRIRYPDRKRSIGKDSAQIQIFGSRHGRRECRALPAKNAGSPHKPGQSPALHARMRRKTPGAAVFGLKAAGFDFSPRHFAAAPVYPARPACPDRSRREPRPPIFSRGGSDPVGKAFVPPT
jgi:hypothetical protein